jgi:hypothetical protein
MRPILYKFVWRVSDVAFLTTKLIQVSDLENHHSLHYYCLVTLQLGSFNFVLV